MKKSATNILVCAIVAFIIALVGVILAWLGLIPSIYFAIDMGLRLSLLILALLFPILAFSGCKCLKRLMAALNCYGRPFIVACFATLIGAIALIIFESNLYPIFYHFLLFAFIFFFMLMIFLWAAVLYNALGKCCESVPKKRRCCNDDDDDDYDCDDD